MSIEAVRDLVEAAPKFVLPLRDGPDMAQQDEPHPLTRFVELDGQPAPPKMVIPGFVQAGVVIVSGQQGVGKTTVLVPLAMVAAGLHARDDPLAPRHWRHLVYVSEDVPQGAAHRGRGCRACRHRSGHGGGARALPRRTCTAHAGRGGGRRWPDVPRGVHPHRWRRGAAAAGSGRHPQRDHRRRRRERQRRGRAHRGAVQAAIHRPAAVAQGFVRMCSGCAPCAAAGLCSLLHRSSRYRMD